jgi:hypothetical protein
MFSFLFHFFNTFQVSFFLYCFPPPSAFWEEPPDKLAGFQLSICEFTSPFLGTTYGKAGEEAYIFYVLK